LSFIVVSWVVGVVGLIVQLAPSSVVQEVDADRERIRRHLAEVELELRGRDTSDLAAEARAARATNIDALHAYWNRGEFPRNVDFVGERRPYFIDHRGTACAVGHLMIQSGAADIAEAIGRDENNALVADIETPGVAHWARRNGLALSELARIQPDYCFCDPVDAPVCGVDGVTYGNACVATECAGVEIAHEGRCEASTGSEWPEPTSTGTTGSGTTSSGTTGSGTTGGGIMSASGNTSVGTSGAATSSGPSGTDVPAEATGEQLATDGTDDGSSAAGSSSRSGCGCGVPGPGRESLAALLVLLFWRRRCDG
jgi:hypothetical protein